jgi:GT2 family glycosyltransferase
MTAIHEARSGTPFFSVIIPAFNSAATLARAIDSVLTQAGEGPEIVVVDDASTDGTAAVLAAYAARIRVVRQPTNQGVAAARNLGATVARGRWLAFLDADDVFYPHRLASHAAWLQDDPALDFLTGDYHYTDEALRITGTSMAASAVGRAVLARADARGRAVLEASDFEGFVARHFGDTHTLSVPRETFLALGGYPRGFRVCEDVHLLTRLVARATRIGVICTPLAAYVVHAASVTRRDPVAAQRENVRTLCDLAHLARDFPRGVRRGVLQRLQGARSDLAHALLRHGRRAEALGVALQALVQTPGRVSLRTLLGILRGCA